MAYDVVDEIKAIMFGWETRSYKDIVALHHRPTGQQKGILGWYLYRGKLGYLAGYHPIFLLFKCAKNITKKPYILGSAAEMMGFFSCYLNRSERTIDDKEFIRYFRKMQIKRLFFVFN